MCLSHTATGLSKLTFWRDRKENKEHKMEAKTGLLSCVSHCDTSVTLILLSLHFPSVYSQYFFKKMISKVVNMIFIKKANSEVKQGHNIFHLTYSIESRQSLHVY